MLYIATGHMGTIYVVVISLQSNKLLAWEEFVCVCSEIFQQNIIATATTTKNINIAIICSQYFIFYFCCSCLCYCKRPLCYNLANLIYIYVIDCDPPEEVGKKWNCSEF